jgi:DNA polymerase-3 subunit epsilon
MREIALDTETTGLDPASGHRIVEIGCVEMIDYMRTGKVFHCYLNPERDMPAEAERIHGLSSAFLKDKPLFTHVADKFMQFIGDDPLVIHNAGFDMKFINFEIARIGHKPLPMTRAIDTVTLARQKFPGQSVSLDALCRRFDIDLSLRVHHGALLDAELLADVYLELRGGRQKAMLLDEEKPKSSESELENTPVTSEKLDVKLRHYSATEAELELHKSFISKQLKKPLWEAYYAEEQA